jgi:hypothetical protein
MARPQRFNADYFSHDADASANEKIIYLESLFGDSGYCWYFKMLEALTASNYYEIDWSDMKCAIYARRFNANNETFKAFIVAATTPEIAAFCIENGKLFSAGLKKRLSAVDEKRIRDAARIAEKRGFGVVAATIPVVAESTRIVAPVNTQSKVKERKVKESKAAIITHNSSSRGENEKNAAAAAAAFEKILPTEKKEKKDTPGGAAVLFSESVWAAESPETFRCNILSACPQLPSDISGEWYQYRVRDWSEKKGEKSTDWLNVAVRFATDDAAKSKLVTSSTFKKNANNSNDTRTATIPRDKFGASGIIKRNP